MILLYELTFLPTGILSLTLWVIGSQFSFFFPFFFLLLIFFFYFLPTFALLSSADLLTFYQSC